MDDPYDNASVQQYAALMEEIKTRLDAIHPIVRSLGQDGKIQPTDFLQAEFCLLQVRFICELVALASLAAHYPLGLHKDLEKSWNAERTFKWLEKVNPNCFPKHAIVTRSDAGIKIEVTRDILDREELKKIYNDCGEMLHRGVIKHIMEGRERVYDLDQIDKWAGRIGIHLSSHAIMMLETGLVLIINLSGGEGGSVSVAVAKGGPAVYLP